MVRECERQALLLMAQRTAPHLGRTFRRIFRADRLDVDLQPPRHHHAGIVNRAQIVTGPHPARQTAVKRRLRATTVTQAVVIGVRQRHALKDGFTYPKTIYACLGQARRLADKLNRKFHTDGFVVHELVIGEKVEHRN